MQPSMQKKFFPASELLHCLGILGGTLLYSLGMNLFVVPAGLYTGGIWGAVLGAEVRAHTQLISVTSSMMHSSPAKT